MRSPIYTVYRLYRNALIRRPYLVNAIQTGAIMGAGDTIAQTIIEKTPMDNYNYGRTIKFASIGFFMCGPVLEFWFGWLHRRVGIDKCSKEYKTLPTTLKKVFIDQAFFAPIYLFVLLLLVGLSQGKSWDKVKRDVDEKFFDVLKLNYCIWPVVQLCNFYFIPREYQVLVGSTIALCWDTYLSWKINN